MAEAQLGAPTSNPTDTATESFVASGTVTQTNKTMTYGSNTFSGFPYDLSIVGFGAYTARVASSYGDNPMGLSLQRAATLTSVTFRCNTADASGNLQVCLTRNGSEISATSTTIAAASQVAGATTTFSQACNVGDIICVYCIGVGTTPGNGLVADITGYF